MHSFNRNKKQGHANTITTDKQISMICIFMQVCIKDPIVPTIHVIPAQRRVPNVK